MRRYHTKQTAITKEEVIEFIKGIECKKNLFIIQSDYVETIKDKSIKTINIKFED